jgi:carbonic anhydrase/acetyltransferase-like protein (isoleucine patch superfamily)
MPGAVIGAHCSLGQNVFVAGGVTIGDHCKIQNNVSLYEGVVLEDHVFCGPSMVFTNVRTPRSAYPRNTSDDYLTTRVRRGATIGANATIVCGVTLHEHAFVAAGAVVTKRRARLRHRQRRARPHQRLDERGRRRPRLRRRRHRHRQRAGTPTKSRRHRGPEDRMSAPTRIPMLDLTPEIEELWDELNAAFQRVCAAASSSSGPRSRRSSARPPTTSAPSTPSA